MKINNAVKFIAGVLFPAAIILGSVSGMAAEVSTDTFRVTIPDEIAMICNTLLTDNGIRFIDRVSEDKGFGGFVASIETFESLGDYGIMPHFSRGGVIELEDGTRLDIVIQKPTDVQCYPDERDHYEKIARAVEEKILPSIEAINGGVYIPQDEVDTAWIYDEVLEGLISAIEEKTDRNGLEEKNYSGVYVYTCDPGENVLDKIGYVFMDVNNDGYQELLIGSVDASGVYDMYTWVDGRAGHLFSSGVRSMHYVMSRDGIHSDGISLEASGGAALNEISFWHVESNREEMTLQSRFVWDGHKDENNPWFVESWDGELKPISREEWNERTGRHGERLSLQYTPLSEYHQ